MDGQKWVNRTLDRLPAALSGISHEENTVIGEVYPKLNIMLTYFGKSI